MCERHWCKTCGGEMIHRDNRRSYESASCLGQIVTHLPHTFTYGDVDGYVHKKLGQSLRLVEHKQPHQSLKGPQMDALELLDACIAIAAPELGLHPESGLWVMRGELRGSTEGHQRCEFVGSQIVTSERIGKVELADESALYEWLDGRTRPT
jgi:hypothetical protein